MIPFPGAWARAPSRSWREEDSPLQRMARLRPSASAVPELMFSTSRCFTFFSTGAREGAQGWRWQLSPRHPAPLIATHGDYTRAEVGVG